MLRIERISKRSAPTRPERHARLTARRLLASTLGLALAATWACSGSTDSASEAEPADVAKRTSASALAISWLPPSIARHEAAIEEAAERNGVEPALLAIVTLVESLGDPRAESPGGARGLMQLMPSTAAHIASERQLVAHSDERLWEPAYNLDLGAWYLSKQLTTFGDGTASARSVELAAMAYNLGPRRARAHLDGDMTLPPETARYRDLIVGMWNERNEPESPTFTAWQQRLEATTPAVKP
jgi:soluble lytic murein transglycosylase-like protein